MARARAARTFTKGTRTRQRIVEQAAVLFNTRGVAGASIADVSLATGLEKGGVYNHFETKEALALAAFDYAAKLVQEAIDAAVEREAQPLEKLYAVIDVFRRVSGKPFIAGGCPLLNAAVDADDTCAVRWTAFGALSAGSCAMRSPPVSSRRSMSMPSPTERSPPSRAA